ncbi:MAG: TetR/AcrR family transcriptional regulator [Sphingomonadales bacterium]|nr:TetR/AcrR family transcriptional regulator [Sphingomonadales bacterium]MDE2567315.1 TetR/AcrR family transcriptional regulator [Sphingomonadales bacterium]
MATQAANRRSQRERSEESDNRLLAAAAAIIATEGYAAATMERVGERAGFSRGLASRKYGSKDGLIEAVIHRVSRHVHHQIDLAVAGEDSPLCQLLATVDRFADLVVTDTSVRAYFVLFSAMIANALQTREAFQQVQEEYALRLYGMIAAGQARGEIASALDPAITAYVVGCLQAGLAVEAAMGGEIDTGAVRAHLRAMLGPALKGSPQAGG